MKLGRRVVGVAGVSVAASAFGCGLFGGKSEAGGQGVSVAPPDGATGQGGAGGTGVAGSGGLGGAAGTGGGGTGGGATGGSGGQARTAPACDGLPGPSMVKVPSPAGVSYCIDSTEVTQAQYAAFLAAVQTKPGTEHPGCGEFNTDYAPPIMGPNDIPGETGKCQPEKWTPATTPNRPVVCIDWCDAYAYCKWAGKRLCGKIGGGEGAVADAKNAKLSQWYDACSQGGTTAYPYGDKFDALVCETGAVNNDGGFASKKDVKSLSTCTGTTSPFTNVYDMSGGVSEFTDECQVGQDGLIRCALRGGTFVDSMPLELACPTPRQTNRGNFFGSTGFRCCKDVP